MTDVDERIKQPFLNESMRKYVRMGLILMMLLSSAYIFYVPSPPYSHDSFYFSVVFAGLLILTEQQQEEITNPTRIRELFVNSAYGKQAGFKPLKDIGGKQFMRSILTNPFTNETIVVWYIYDTTWVDLEVYKGKYKVGDDLDSLLLDHKNHILIEKSIDSLENYVRRTFLSGGLKETRDMMKKFGLTRDIRTRHKITNRIKEQPVEVTSRMNNDNYDEDIGE